MDVEDIESILENMPTDHVVWSATWRCVGCSKAARLVATTPEWSVGPPTCRCECGGEMLAVDANVDHSAVPAQCYSPSGNSEESERN